MGEESLILCYHGLEPAAYTAEVQETNEITKLNTCAKSYNARTFPAWLPFFVFCTHETAHTHKSTTILRMYGEKEGWHTSYPRKAADGHSLHAGGMRKESRRN